MAALSAGSAMPAAAQSTRGLPPGESLEQPTEVNTDFPRLPPGFNVREAAEPEALLQVVLEGFTGPVYQSNVYDAPNNEASDVVWVGAPRVRLIHDGPEFDAEVGLQAELGRYFDETRNDYEDFSGSVSALWGDTDRDYSRLRAQYGRDHQSIGADIDSPQREAAEVTKYWRAEFLYDASAKFDQLLFAPQFRVRNYDYEDSRRLDGTRIDSGGKNRTEIDSNFRLGWEFQPQLWAILDPGVNWRFYERERNGPSQFDRDSFGLRPRAGVLYGTDESELFAVFSLGLAMQDYEDDRFSTVSTFGFLGELAWRITDDRVLSMDVERDVGETTLAGASAAISTRARLRYSHMLTDEVSVRVSGEVEERDFEIEKALRPADRTDDIYKLGAELNYMFSEAGYTGLAVDYVARDSTDPTVEFDGVEVSARIGARF